MQGLLQQSAFQIAHGIRNQQFKAEDYVSEVLERIDECERTIHAYITILRAESLKKARDLDRRISRGEKVGSLSGVTMAVKDNICTEGIETTCGSRILQGFTPPYDATVIQRIKEADAVIIGKANMDEFAMGSSTEHSSYGPTLNPLNTDLVPGGSSGGSAAAVASGEAAAALGADTGGSIRCPAAFCSVVGLKPTYGLVSRYGLVAYANSLDQIGPIARDVQDVALILSVVAGHDSMDSTSVDRVRVNYEDFLKNDVVGMKIGVPREFFGEGTDEKVSRAVWRSLEKLEGEGARVEETSLKSLEHSLAAYYIIAMSEASSNLARYDGVRYGLNQGKSSQDWVDAFVATRSVGFGKEVKRRIMLGTYALSAGYYEAYYLKAQKIRTLMKRDIEKSFRRFDVLIGPTMPMLPFKLGEKIEDPLQMYMADIDTVPANLTGLPAISVPCGSHDNLQVGMQIIAPAFREDILLQIGYSIEQFACRNRGT